MTQDPPRDTYKVSEVASRLGFSDDKVRRMVEDGELVGMRVGGLIMITVESYEALMARVRASAPRGGGSFTMNRGAQGLSLTRGPRARRR